MLHNHQKYVLYINRFAKIKLIKLITKLWLMVKILNVKKINSIVKHIQIIFIYSKKSRSNVKEKKDTQKPFQSKANISKTSLQASTSLYILSHLNFFLLYKTHNKSVLNKNVFVCFSLNFFILLLIFFSPHSAACSSHIFQKVYCTRRAHTTFK